MLLCEGLSLDIPPHDISAKFCFITGRNVYIYIYVWVAYVNILLLFYEYVYAEIQRSIVVLRIQLDNDTLCRLLNISQASFFFSGTSRFSRKRHNNDKSVASSKEQTVVIYFLTMIYVFLRIHYITTIYSAKSTCTRACFPHRKYLALCRLILYNLSTSTRRFRYCVTCCLRNGILDIFLHNTWNPNIILRHESRIICILQVILKFELNLKTI